MGETYLGTPVFDLEGSVVAEGPSPTDELRLSLFWIGFDSIAEERTVVEQRTFLDSGLARFRVSLFDSPGEDALRFEGVGIALLVLYADNNDNGMLNRGPISDGPDIVVGASASHLLVYAEEPVSADSLAGKILGAVPAGYHLFENASGHTCTFVYSQGCAGAGTLQRVEGSAEVLLRLEADPEQVQVPNPQVPGESSGTSMEPGSLYNSHE